MKAADRVSRQILDRVTTGDYAIGSPIPSEAAIANDLRVSRLTVRESVRELAALGVIDVHQGRRNRIAPTSEWSVLSSSVVSAMVRITDVAEQLLTDLLEARRSIEVSVARLAAERITDAQLTRLADTIDTMRRTRATTGGDALAANVQADIDFHETILDASGNVYLRSVYGPLREILAAVRFHTSASTEVRTEALAHHEAIHTALANHDPDAASRAMEAHMDQTLRAHSQVDLTTLDLNTARR